METRFRIDSSRVMHEKIEGEVIAIDLATGTYYSIREAGATIWAQVERSAAEGEIVAAVATAYEAPDGEIERGVRAFLDELAAEGLIEPAISSPADGAASALPTEQLGARETFVPPVLEKHTDMQDLILLDPVHEVDARGWPHTADQAQGARE